MSLFLEKIEKEQNKIVFLTKCVLLVIGLLTAVPYINALYRDIYKVCIVWCFFLTIYLFVKNRQNFMRKEYIFLLLFCVSYVVTIILRRSHFINEVAMLGYTGILFFTLTYYDRGRSEKDTKKELKILSWIIIIATFIFSLIGFAMFLFSLSGYFQLAGQTYVYGMRENRLWGLYNPNTGAVLNYISGIFSLLLIKYEGKKKKFLVFNLVLQSFCFILTQSRGGWICLLAYVIIYMIYVKKWKKDFRGIRNWLYRGVLTVLTCLALYGGGEIVKTGLSYAPTGIARIIYSDEEFTKKHNELKRLDKKHKNLESMTTGRFGMWKIGLQAYAENPVMGIGYRSIDDTLKEMMDKHSYDNSSAGGLHNVYVTTLVSGGAAGFLLILGFAVVFLKRGIILFFDKTTKSYVRYLLIFIPVWLIGEFAESRILFGMNFLAITFWITAGYCMYYTKKENMNGKSDRSSV